MNGPINIDLTNIESVLNPAFVPLLYDQSRTILLRGGRGSGKSVAYAQKLIYRILNSLDKPDVKHNIIVFRKHSSNTNRSVVRQIRQVINDWSLNSLVEYFKVDKVFQFIDGSQIMITGIDEPEKIKSIHEPTSTVLEEGTEFTFDDFTQIDLSLRGKKPVYFQNILAFNPISVNNWIYKYFYQNGKLPNTHYHLSTFRDNLFIDEEYGERLEQLAEPPAAQQEVLLHLDAKHAQQPDEGQDQEVRRQHQVVDQGHPGCLSAVRVVGS